MLTWDRRGRELPHDDDRTPLLPRATPVEEQHDLANFDLAFGRNIRAGTASFGATAEPNNVSDYDCSKAAPALTSDLEAIAIAEANLF